MADVSTKEDDKEEAGLDESRMSGYVSKKRGHGIRSWQLRYLRLNARDLALCYYKNSNDSFPLGFIPFAQISAVNKVSAKRNYGFDVVTKLRVHSFRTNTEEQADDWVRTITEEFQNMKVCLKISGSIEVFRSCSIRIFTNVRTSCL